MVKILQISMSIYKTTVTVDLHCCEISVCDTYSSLGLYSFIDAKKYLTTFADLNRYSLVPLA